MRQRPASEQDAITLATLRLAGVRDEPKEIDPAHLHAVLDWFDEAQRRELPSDAEAACASSNHETSVPTGRYVFYKVQRAMLFARFKPACRSSAR